MDENNLTQQAAETAAENNGTAAEAGGGNVSDAQLAASQRLLELLGFAEAKDKNKDDKGESGGINAGANKADEAKEPESKTYSQSELEAEIAKALEAKEEEARLAKLPEAERNKAQAENAQNEVARLKAELLARDLRQEAVGKLDKEGLPVRLAELLDYSNKEAMAKSMAAVEEIFKESLQGALLARLKGKTPPGLGQSSNSEKSLQETIAKGIRGGM